MGEQPPFRRNEFIEWNFKAELYAFGKRLGEDFREDVLWEALTEKSYNEKEEQKLLLLGIEKPRKLNDNEYLAKNGEEFMNLYIRQYLDTVLPKLPEKYIIAIRDFLMSEDVLANVSKHIGIDDLVLTAEVPVEKSTLFHSLKAVIGALIASSGPVRAGNFVRDFVITQLAEMDFRYLCSPEKPLEVLSSILGDVPTESRLILESAKNTLLATYEVGIYVNKKLIGKGYGEDAKIAEEVAALNALWKIWGIPSHRRPMQFNLELSLLSSKPELKQIEQ